MHADIYLEDQEFIALCDLLKLAGLVETGGQAKASLLMDKCCAMAK